VLSQYGNFKFANIIVVSARNVKKKKERPVFESIRKPVAPRSKKFGGDRPEERIHPTQRKAKHKKGKAAENQDGDL
jgi:hypothetical protein